jgi:hypothetical protein
LWLPVFTSAQNPEEQKYRQQRDKEVNDSTLPVEFAGQETGIDFRGQRAEHKDSESILDHGQRERHGKHQRFSPGGSQ